MEGQRLQISMVGPDCISHSIFHHQLHLQMGAEQFSKEVKRKVDQTYSEDPNNQGVSNKGMEAYNFFGLLHKFAIFASKLIAVGP